MENKRHVFIVNPAAGKDSCLKEMEDFVDSFSASNLRCELETSLGKGDCERIAKRICLEAADEDDHVCFYVCGGDGTLNEVVNGIMHSGQSERVALTHIPRGSGNDFIKNFDSIDEKTDLIKFFLGNVRGQKIDVIKVNDRYCLSICSFGLDARIGTNIERFRRHWWLNGKRAYIASFLTNIWKGIGRKMTIEFTQEQDDFSLTQTLSGDWSMVCVANGAFYGGSFHPVPEAKIDDGILDVLFVKKMSTLRLLFLLSAYKNGDYKKIPEADSTF